MQTCYPIIAVGTCTEVLKKMQPLSGQNQNLSKNGPLLKSEGQKQVDNYLYIITVVHVKIQLTF